jgi:hypothetical protein
MTGHPALGKPDLPHAMTIESRVFPARPAIRFDFPQGSGTRARTRPAHMETLKFLLQSKKADSTRSQEVVSEATAWMHQQLRNAEIAYHYADGGSGFGAYGYFQIKSLLKDIKIAEIHGAPYASAEVRVRGHHENILFPYFGEIGSEDGRLNILHFIADFVLSTTPDLTEL